MSHHHTYYVTHTTLLIQCRLHKTKKHTSSYILCHIIIHTMSHHAIGKGAYTHSQTFTMSHHHTYYVTPSYILCHIIHTMSHHTYYVTSCNRQRRLHAFSNILKSQCASKCTISLHCREHFWESVPNTGSSSTFTMSHHHTYYVTSSYILCHIIIHTMSHHHTYYVTSYLTRGAAARRRCPGPGLRAAVLR